jgi:hypothetical protein
MTKHEDVSEKAMDRSAPSASCREEGVDARSGPALREAACAAKNPNLMYWVRRHDRYGDDGRTRAANGGPL